MPMGPSERERIVFGWAFARLDVLAFAVAGAIVAALALFSLTGVLVLKGAPPGVQVGSHLAVLANYFPGYSVTFRGAMVGAVYAAIVGGAAALIPPLMWNAAHRVLFRLLRTRAALGSYSID